MFNSKKTKTVMVTTFTLTSLTGLSSSYSSDYFKSQLVQTEICLDNIKRVRHVEKDDSTCNLKVSYESYGKKIDAIKDWVASFNEKQGLRNVGANKLLQLISRHGLAKSDSDLGLLDFKFLNDTKESLEGEIDDLLTTPNFIEVLFHSATADLVKVFQKKRKERDDLVAKKDALIEKLDTLKRDLSEKNAAGLKVNIGTEDSEGSQSSRSFSFSFGSTKSDIELSMTGVEAELKELQLLIDFKEIEIETTESDIRLSLNNLGLNIPDEAAAKMIRTSAGEEQLKLLVISANFLNFTRYLKEKGNQLAGVTNAEARFNLYQQYTGVYAVLLRLMVIRIESYLNFVEEIKPILNEIVADSERIEEQLVGKVSILEAEIGVLDGQVIEEQVQGNTSILGILSDEVSIKKTKIKRFSKQVQLQMKIQELAAQYMSLLQERKTRLLENQRDLKVHFSESAIEFAGAEQASALFRLISNSEKAAEVYDFEGFLSDDLFDPTQDNTSEVLELTLNALDVIEEKIRQGKK